ncbi:N-acetylglucosaminyl-diphospho-decaprenol L-rhamnosyltransferase [Methylacidimicrobium cyclopophantes]|uniref:N-acetylglucosaminyl-diphospho-decaprenol L-rhamnosyltransferase n=1 Tax=Methylacidimicrobium cyclopophantes TaxID=1041766 RepID=A0A5E6MAV1_9BACT|nr:glycosyltransferase family 2 protein [Methylacidimicrobium cyclopophantes]VVM06535.1 N-acetylglucosaminyl-diphospho-decaprenol L-rhamnosyltransferase [Methylacidimicrobium cyclopophantes]
MSGGKGVSGVGARLVRRERTMRELSGEDRAAGDPAKEAKQRIAIPLSRSSAVGAVVVTWNSVPWIEGLMALLSQASAEGFQKVVFVDTGSTDGTVALVRAKAAGSVQIIETGNVGYAAGLNVGIRAFGSDRPPFFLLLNPDITAEPGFLDRMLEEVVKHSADPIGIADPRILEPTVDGKWVVTNRRRRNLWGWPCPSQEAPGISWTEAAHGACSLIRREVIERIGLFDEDYFLYWEEIDYCLRARRAGFRVAGIDCISIRHHPGEVRDGKNAKSETGHYYFWRNQWLYAGKAYGPWLGALFVLVRLPIFLREGFRLVCEGDFHLFQRAVQGLLMGCLGQKGPAHVQSRLLVRQE